MKEEDLRDSIEATAKALGVRAAQKNLELVCHCDPDVPRLAQGDPGRLRQVLVNLVGNAIKFTQRGEVVVRADKVSGTSDDYGGTGLGLSIASQLVAMMGGRIWVESEVGQGSTFHFTVRLGVTALPPEPAGRTRAATLRGLRVMVVDDNATNRSILGESLSSWEMTPTLAPGGTDALSLLRRAGEAGESFPLIITDAQMPSCLTPLTVSGKVMPVSS